MIKLMPTSAPDTSTTRGDSTTTGTTAECKKAVELYNRGTTTSDLKLKESLLKDALAAGCTENKVLARIHNNLADCYEQQGKLDEALTGYTKAIELDPQLYTAHLGLGDIAKKQGKISSAIGHYRSALKRMRRQGASVGEIELIEKNIVKLQEE